MGHANNDERKPAWYSIGGLLSSLCPPTLSSHFERYPRVLKDKVRLVWEESSVNAPATALRDASAYFLRSMRIDLKSDTALIPSVTMLFAGYAVSRLARAFAERRYRLPEILWEFRRTTHHLNHFIRLHLVLVSQLPTASTTTGFVLTSSSSSSSSFSREGSESDSSVTDMNEGTDPEGTDVVPDVHSSILSGHGSDSMKALGTAKEGDEESDESLEAKRQNDSEGFAAATANSQSVAYEEASSRKMQAKSLALSPPQEEIEEADALSQWCIAVWSLKPIAKRIALVEDLRQIEGLGHLERRPRAGVTYMPISFDTTLYNPHLNDEHGQGATQFMTVFVNSSYTSYMSMRRLGFWEDHSLRPLMVDAWTALVSMLHELLRAAIVADRHKKQKRSSDDGTADDEENEKGGLGRGGNPQRLHCTRKQNHSVVTSSSGTKTSISKITSSSSSSSSSNASTDESSSDEGDNDSITSSLSSTAIIVVPDHILTRAVGICDVLMSSSYSLWSLDGARTEYGGGEVQPRRRQDSLLFVVDGEAMQDDFIAINNKGHPRKYKLLSPFIDDSLVSEARALLAPSFKVAMANTISRVLFTLRRFTSLRLGDSVVSSKTRIALDDSKEYRRDTTGMGARSNVKLSASSASAYSLPYHSAATSFTIVDYARLKLSGWGTVFNAWRVMASFVSWGPLVCWLGFCLAASGTALAERFFNKYITASGGSGGGSASSSSLLMYSPLNSNSLIGSDVQIMSLCDEALRKFILSARLPSTISGISTSSYAVLSDAGGHSGDAAARGGDSLGLFFASAVFSAFVSVLEVICTDLEEYNEEIVKQRLMRSAETRTTLLCCAQNTHTIIGGRDHGGFVSRQFERLGRIESITSLMYYSISSTMRLGEVALVFADLPVAMVCATLATYGVVRLVFSARRNFARVKVARHHFSAGGKAEAVLKAKQIRTFTDYVRNGARSLVVHLGRRRGGARQRRRLNKDGSHISDDNDDDGASSYSAEAEAFLVLEESNADDSKISNGSSGGGDCRALEDSNDRGDAHRCSLISSPSLAMLMLQQRLGALRGTPSAQQSSGGGSSMFGGIDVGAFSFLRQSHANPCTGVQGERYWSLLQCEEEGRGGGGGIVVASAVAARDRRPCFGLVLLLSVAAELREKTSSSSPSSVVGPHCSRSQSLLLTGVAPYPHLWLPVTSFYLSSAFTPIDTKELGQGLKAAERWCEMASDVLSVVVTLQRKITTTRRNTSGHHVHIHATTPLLLLATMRGVSDLNSKARMLRESLSYSSSSGFDMASIDVSCPKVTASSTYTTQENAIGEAKGEGSYSLEEKECETSSTVEHKRKVDEDNVDPANTLGWPKEIWELYGKNLLQNNGNDGSLKDNGGEGHAPRESANHSGGGGLQGFSEEVLNREVAPPAAAFLSSTNGRGFPCGASKDADYFTQLLRMTGLEQTYVSAASYVEACEAVTMGPDAAITHDFASLARHVSSQLLGGSTGGGGLAAVAEMDMETLLFDRVPQQKAAIVEAAAGLGSAVDEKFARANNETTDDRGTIEKKEGAILAAAAAAKTLTTQFLGISYSVHEPYTSASEDLLPKRVFSEDETWQAVSELGHLLSSSSQTKGNRQEVKEHGKNRSASENNSKDADVQEENDEAFEEKDNFADATPSYRRMIDHFHTLSASQKEASLALVRSWELSSVEIVFDNVSFSYPDYPYDYVLKNISFVIPRGSFVGVVGKSGCGKSTLLALLIGLYAPTEGRILFNGVEVVGDGKMRAPAAQTSVCAKREMSSPSSAHSKSLASPSESESSSLSPSPRAANSSSNSTLMSPHQSGPVSYPSSSSTARAISALPMRALRRRIAYVGSLCDFFPATISANIVLGDAVSMLALRPKSGGHGELEDPEVRDERIRASIQRALIDAQADAFVAASVGGLETRLGKLFYSAYDEAGGGMGSGGPFSGGELQRLMIARAFAKDPQHTLLYVMDEATCSLDAETERLVQERFVKVKENASASVKRGGKLPASSAASDAETATREEEGHYGPRTCVVAAHRLATLKPASLIFVLDEGRLVQQGSWEELAGDESGLFSTFIAAQKLQLYDEYEAARTAHHSTFDE